MKTRQAVKDWLEEHAEEVVADITTNDSELREKASNILFCSDVMLRITEPGFVCMELSKAFMVAMTIKTISDYKEYKTGKI
jgi:hypothetical protein